VCAPHALQALFSPEHGYFVWTPLAALAVLGLLVALSASGSGSAVVSVSSRNTRVWIALLLMAALQVYISGSVDSWTVAGGFGQRRFVALTTVLVIGVAVLMSQMPRRKLWIAATVVCVYWNVALTAEFATGLMDRQKLEPAKNAYAAFVTLPRMAPRLAYRYLFDRQSFYRANFVSR
jgi:hypothetical protein